MKVNGRGDLVYMITILFTVLFGCLTSIPKCTGRSYPDGLVTTSISNAAAVNSSMIVDERKLEIIFCAIPAPVYFGACYCCLSVNPKKCWEKKEDCQANCPSCNPHCPHT
ncbi:hypothetical protein HU200_051863 [Digitaria exilis]|uniref:Uncharacterized protein n=1 Tax=Digitaria exilis TaxID=1010633 RepID=A0A835AS25_9POAL|nr:hypothetical protein HU200_051863 [Digitaria exilis]